MRLRRLVDFLNEVLSITAQEYPGQWAKDWSVVFLNEVLSITAQESYSPPSTEACPTILNEVLSITAQELLFWTGEGSGETSSMKS